MPRRAFTRTEIEATRRRICDAALRVFERDGYAAATMRSIGSEAGCSAAAPYLYFRSKEDLLASLRADGFRLLGERLDAAARSTPDPLEQLRRVLVACLEFGVARPELYRLMFAFRQGNLARAPRVRAARKWSFGIVRRVYSHLIEAGLASGDATTETHLLWVNVHGLVSLHLARQLDQGRDFESLVRPLVDHWAKPLATKRTRRHGGTKCACASGTLSPRRVGLRRSNLIRARGKKGGANLLARKVNLSGDRLLDPVKADRERTESGSSPLQGN